MSNLIKLIIGFCLTATIPAFAAEYPFDVKVSGQGEDIFMLPGLASSAEVWDDTAEELAKRYRIHQFGLSGFAGVAPVKGPLLRTWLQGFLLYLHENEIRSATVMGHGLGGILAIQLALLAPENIARLIVVNTLPFSAQVFLRATTKETAKPLAMNLRRQMLGSTQEQFRVHSKRQLRYFVSGAENLKLLQGWNDESDIETIVNATYESLLIDLREPISKIQIPVLILYSWHEDSPYKTSDAEQLYQSQYAALTTARLQRIDNSLDFIMLDQPALFQEQVNVFLSD